MTGLARFVPRGSAPGRATRASALTLVALLAGCTSTPPGSAADATAATSPGTAASEEPNGVPGFGEPAELSVGLATVSALQWPYYAAVDQGFYEEAQINLEIIVTESNAKAVQGLIAESLDLAGGSPDPAIRAVDQGEELVITGSVMNRPIYTQVAQADVGSYEDLRGKRVGVSGIKSMDGLWMRQLIEAHGLDPDSDVEIVEIGGTSQRYAALKSGGVEAALLTQPADFQALREGFVDLGKTTEIADEIIWSGYTVRRDWAQENEALLVRFLEVQRRAAQWLYDPANRDEAIRVLMEATNSEEADAVQTYDLWITEEALAPRGEATESAIQAMIDSLVEIEELSGDVTVDDVFDPSYMEQAAAAVP